MAITGYEYIQLGGSQVSVAVTDDSPPRYLLASDLVVSGGGDATAAKQDTGNTSLGSIDGKLHALGQNLKAASMPVTIASDQTVLSGGQMVTVSTEVTRPNDTNAYAANDVVSDSTSATTIQTLTGAARLTGGSGYIVGAKLFYGKKSLTPRFRIHIFNTTGETVAADNVANKSVYADIAKRVALIDLPALQTAADTTNSDMSYASDYTLRIPFVTTATANLFFFVETLDAFTPAAQDKFTVQLYIDQN